MSTYIYARQSVEHAEGIERQITRCRSLCAAKGWPVAEIFEDNATSAYKSRAAGSAWARMLDSLEAGDVIVAVDVDRLLRSLEDLVTLQKAGARVLTLDGEIDTTSADGAFRASMLAAIAQFEARRKAERQTRANLHRATHGKPNPGRRRYGYEISGTEIRESEAVHVRRMYADILAGKTLRSIWRALDAEGVDPAPGKSWSANRVRYILQNPFYAGRHVHRGVVTESEHIPAVVTADTFEAVQAILSAEGRRTTPGPKAINMLSGLVECTECGSTLKKMGRSYSCPNLHNSILTSTLEEIVPWLIVWISSSEPLTVEEGTATTGNINALLDALAANDAEVSQTLQDRAEGLVTAGVARDALVTLRDAREALEARLASAREATGDVLAWVEAGRLFTDSIETEDDIRARFLDLDLDAQRSVIRGLLELKVIPGRHFARVLVRGKWVERKDWFLATMNEDRTGLLVTTGEGF